MAPSGSYRYGQAAPAEGPSKDSIDVPHLASRVSDGGQKYVDKE